MSRLSLRSAWLRVLCDRRASQKARLEALSHIERPGKKLLRSLLADGKLPPALRYEVTKAYELSEAESDSRKDSTPVAPTVKPVACRTPLSPEELKALLG